MVKFLKLTILAVVVAMLGPSATFGLDQQLLNNLGGVYEGRYVSGYTEILDSGGVTLPITARYDGRVVIPKRKGKKLKGSFDSGAGRLDFRQRVRNIKNRRSSAVYRGPIILTIRAEDNPDGNPPFVGTFRAKAVKNEKGEFLKMTFRATQVVENGGGDRVFSIDGRFTTRPRFRN